MATAIEQLKSIFSVFPTEDPRVSDIPSLLYDWAQAKQYDFAALRTMQQQGLLSPLVFNRLLRRPNLSDLHRYWLETMLHPEFYSRHYQPKTRVYTASDEQNAQIDRAVQRFGPAALRADPVFLGHGAAAQLLGVGLRMSEKVRADTPILIIGRGVSGHMAAYPLFAYGFRNLHIVDKTGKSGGIWLQDNVRSSRNNPRNLNLSIGVTFSLPKAPGDGSSVLKFITDLRDNTAYANQITGSVASIERTADGYQVKIDGGKEPLTLTFPIVINCIGMGKPKPLSDATRMTSDVSTTEAGPRWQQILKPEDVKGKRLCFIGLGNSTGEMMVQMEKFIRDGVDTDYRVLTHYPKDAIHNPEYAVPQKKQVFQVFRDLSIPNLTAFTGDLEPHRIAYFAALHNNRIVPDIKHWTKKRGAVGTASVRRDGIGIRRDRIETEVDGTYPLLGYQIPTETYRQMGIPVVGGYREITDGQPQYPHVDYDGEFHGLPGYFGLGPVIETPQNKNAVVIPGNLFRLNDMIAGVVIRAYEYQARQAGQVK